MILISARSPSGQTAGGVSVDDIVQLRLQNTWDTHLDIAREMAVVMRADMAAYDAEVRQSQARRWVVYEALRNGAYFPWDYQPLQKASERYMRNHMDLNEVEDGQRYPRGE